MCVSIEGALARARVCTRVLRQVRACMAPARGHTLIHAWPRACGGGQEPGAEGRGYTLELGVSLPSVSVTRHGQAHRAQTRSRRAASLTPPPSGPPSPVRQQATCGCGQVHTRPVPETAHPLITDLHETVHTTHTHLCPSLMHLWHMSSSRLSSSADLRAREMCA